MGHSALRIARTENDNSALGRYCQRGAGRGNRTLVLTLARSCSTIEPYPRQVLPNKLYYISIRIIFQELPSGKILAVKFDPFDHFFL